MDPLPEVVSSVSGSAGSSLIPIKQYGWIISASLGFNSDLSDIHTVRDHDRIRKLVKEPDTQCKKILDKEAPPAADEQERWKSIYKLVFFPNVAEKGHDDKKVEDALLQAVRHLGIADCSRDTKKMYDLLM